MPDLDDQSGPTVIVSRRVAPDHLDDFAQWHAELLEAAGRFAGYVGAASQPPDPLHPEEWITRFQFKTTAELDAWMESTERQALLATGDPLIDGPVREHRVARPGSIPDVVTAVISKRLKPDVVTRYRDAQGRVDAAMAEFPGFLGSSVSEPIPGVQDEHVTVFMFDSKERLDRWLDSSERRQVLAEFDALIEGDQKMTVYGGFGGWFSGPQHAAPKRWKQAASVLLALYPTVVALTLLQRAIAPDPPLLPTLFVSNVASVAILTWILMPQLTRGLASWLAR